MGRFHGYGLCVAVRGARLSAANELLFTRRWYVWHTAFGGVGLFFGLCRPPAAYQHLANISSHHVFALEQQAVYITLGTDAVALLPRLRTKRLSSLRGAVEQDKQGTERNTVQHRTKYGTFL